MNQPLADPAAWKGPVNSVLYVIQFAPVLDRAKAEDVAGAILADRVLGGGADLYREAIRGALAQTGPIGDEIPTDHSEPDLRVFLEHLRDALADRDH